jgi:hypothetical protein
VKQYPSLSVDGTSPQKKQKPKNKAKNVKKQRTRKGKFEPQEYEEGNVILM